MEIRLDGMRNTFEIHEKYIWTLKRASDGNIQITVLILRSSQWDEGIVVVIINYFPIIVTVVIEHPHHCDWIWQKPAALKATDRAAIEDGGAQTTSWANIAFPLLYIIQIKSFLRPHDHLHWDLIIAIVVKEMMIIVEEPPAYLLKQLEALLSLPIASPPSRVEVEDQAVEVADRDDLLRRWWGGSASPWWQTPSSSSWRHRGRWIVTTFGATEWDRRPALPSVAGWGQLVVADWTGKVTF